MKKQAAFVLLSLLYLASTLATIQAGSTIKVFVDSDKTLNLTCDGYNSGDFEWTKDDQSIDTVAQPKKDSKDSTEYYKKGKNGELMLTYHEGVYGKYKCNTSSSNNITEIKLVKPPVLIAMENKSVVEGEILELICTFAHVEPEDVKIIWEFNGTEYHMSKDRIMIEDSNTTEGKTIAHAKFTLKTVQMSDRGFVTCKAAYNWPDIEEHMSIVKVHIRVKDKLAALWPFLGICAEVVVLCAIILIYEKKRNKAELEESDTDQSPDTKPTPNKDSDVRQRK